MASRLGTKLRKLRTDKGFTLDALAEKSGLSKSYIWELENRESQRQSAEKLNSLADVFGLTPAYFLEDDTRSPEEQHRDQGFFRAYQQLDADSKQQLQKILETFKKNT